MKRFIPIIILLFIVVGFFIFGVDENLNFDVLALEYADLSVFVDDNPILSIFGAMLIYILATALSFPVAWLLSVSIGLIFGFFVGSLIVLFGATIGATILFLLAKYAFADFFKKRSGDFLKKMAKGFRNGAASYLLFLRLVPVFPFALVNVMPGILNVKSFTFIWTTFIGIIPGVIAYIYAGVGLRSIIVERALACEKKVAPCGQGISPSDFITKEMIFAFIILGIVALIPVVLKVIKKRVNNEKVKCDLCVIGAGSGGLSVAAGAVAFGASVILVEKDKMGGDCLNVGCVPSKAFIAAAKKAYEYKDAQKFGIEYEKPKVDFKKVQAHVSDIIAQIAPHDSVERFEGLGVNVIKGEGRFINEKTLQVNAEQISAKRFVIATGSSPAVPPIKGLDTVDYLTNENIFELKSLPKHLAIIGGGPIGIELAQAFNRLGAKVSVIEKFNALAKDDVELTKIALDNIREEGVNILENTDVVEIKKSAKGINIFINEGEEIICSHLLVATGRKKNTDGLGLEEANVEFDRAGIKTNAALLTSNKKIFAIGDVINGMQFTHVAGHQASLVIKKAIFGLPIKQNQNIIPHVTYCDPEIAYVGMSENEVKAKYNDDYKVIRSKLSDNDRAKAMRKTLGLVKLILSKKGEILGVGIAAKNAGELINFFSYAIANKQKIGSFVKFIAPYPTISEIVRRVAIESYKDKLSNPLLKIFTKFIRLLP